MAEDIFRKALCATFLAMAVSWAPSGAAQLSKNHQPYVDKTIDFMPRNAISHRVELIQTGRIYRRNGAMLSPSTLISSATLNDRDCAFAHSDDAIRVDPEIIKGLLAWIVAKTK
jgi:hypothetical protein